MSERHVRIELAPESLARSLGLVRAAVGRIREAGLEGLVDVIPAYATVLVELVLGIDAERADAAVREAIVNLEPAPGGEGRLVEIPVCYDGEHAPDIAGVAAAHGLTAGEVAALHSSGEYAACFVGFQPGFAYLAGLPAKLETPRLDRPRARVPAGSVGIAGNQTGVYPFASPGGWRLIGRTPVQMFEASREHPALVEMGDRVRFVRIGAEEFRRMEAETGPPRAVTAPAGGIRVIEAGMQTTVQDLGRPGHAALGIVRGGAADGASLIAANRLVGNEDGAAGLEMTLTGCSLEFEQEAVVAVCGGGAAITGPVDAGMARAFPVAPNERVTTGRMTTGARAYLAVRGGIDVPLVMGSAATHLGAGFGGFEGRALRAGDRLAVHRAVARRQAALSHHPHSAKGDHSLRLVPGSQYALFTTEARAALLKSQYRVAPQSNRVGIRLEGPALGAPGGGRMLSEGMMWGAVQVPEDGQPIVLGVDHPTTGGYPVIACVAAIDLPVLGQLRPGDTVHFSIIDRAEAARLAAGSV